jgi:hypothetical protein
MSQHIEFSAPEKAVWLFDRDSVRFWVMVDSLVLPCTLTHEALVTLDPRLAEAGQDDERLGLDAYHEHRPHIEEVAKEKALTGLLYPNGEIKLLDIDFRRRAR